MKKLALWSALILVLSFSLAIFAGCGDTNEQINEGTQHEHVYEETQIAATCTTEGYTLYKCECGDSYNGDVVIPKTNHTGIGTCNNCNMKFDTIWKNFINEYGNNGYVVFDDAIMVVLSFTDDYDCMLSALYSSNDGSWHDEEMLTLGYNIYDQKWSWLLDSTFGLVSMPEYDASGTAYGSFNQWSSHSSSINCTMRTGDLKNMSDSTLLSTIKTLYNKILDCANTKLEECGINITMANFGLEK